MMSMTFDKTPRKAWYLGHSAWLIETGLQRFLFDYGRVPERPAAGGSLLDEFNSAAAADRPLTVFFSHQHGDHYNPGLHRQLTEKDTGKDPVQVIVGLDARQKVPNMPERQTVVMRPHDSQQIGDLTIHASGSTDSGVSFLVMAPEMTCYHGGDLAAWDDTVWFRETYRREIDWLASRLTDSGRMLDVAMLPVSTSDGYQEDVLLEGVDYALEKLRPRQVLPMHAFGFEGLYQDFADRERRKDVPVLVHCPFTVPVARREKLDATWAEQPGENPGESSRMLHPGGILLV